MRFIYWYGNITADGLQFAHIHVIGDYQHTLVCFMSLVENLRRTFPDVLDHEIQLGVIRQSIQYKEFSIISCNKMIQKRDYPGWKSIELNNETHIPYGW